MLVTLHGYEVLTKAAGDGDLMPSAAYLPPVILNARLNRARSEQD